MVVLAVLYDVRLEAIQNSQVSVSVLLLLVMFSVFGKLKIRIKPLCQPYESNLLYSALIKYESF